MKRNSHIHLLLETELKNKLRDESRKKGISLSELCRQKLGKDQGLEKIQRMLEILIKNEK